MRGLLCELSLVNGNAYQTCSSCSVLIWAQDMGKISMRKLSSSFSGLVLKRWTEGQGVRSLRLKFSFKAPSHTGKQWKMFLCLMKNRPPPWDVRCSAYFMDFYVATSSRSRLHTRLLSTWPHCRCSETKLSIVAKIYKLREKTQAADYIKNI